MTMSKPLSFTKMHGLGNDFVVVDATQKPVSLTPATIRQMADRHTGIGFDQLLIVGPSPKPHIDFSYQIFNADGNPVEQCGNGARCLGRYVYERGLTQKLLITVATQARELTLTLQDNDCVSVDMGRPEFEPSLIPFTAPSTETVYSLSIDGIGELQLAALSVGNPHAVLNVASIANAPVDHWGQCINEHSCFPQGVNVDFMEVVDRQHIKLRVYERGVGETLACGSGACAAMVAGCRQNLLDNAVTVTLPGGDLQVTWEPPSSPILMTGPATFVFDGRWLWCFDTFYL